MSHPHSRVWAVRLAYLLPLLSAVALLILAATPCFFFQSRGEAFESMSLFGVMTNTYENCKGFLDGTASGSTSALYFSYVMSAILLVSLILMVLYAVFILFTALLFPFIWTPNAPGHPTVNQLKRAYRILVPNRGCYVVCNLLPILPSCFPYFLELFYNKLLGDPATLHYLFLPNPIITAVLCALSVTLFLTTLTAQRENRMDLFRIYKL